MGLQIKVTKSPAAQVLAPLSIWLLFTPTELTMRHHCCLHAGGDCRRILCDWICLPAHDFSIYKSDSLCFPLLLLGRISTPITFKSKQELVKTRVECHPKLTGKRNKARIGHKRFCIKDGKLCSIALNILNRTFRRPTAGSQGLHDLHHSPTRPAWSRARAGSQG